MTEHKTITHIENKDGTETEAVIVYNYQPYERETLETPSVECSVEIAQILCSTSGVEIEVTEAKMLSLEADILIEHIQKITNQDHI